MIGEKNEKNLFFFKIITISVIYIVISLFAFFAFCVIQVNAADYSTLNPTNIDTELRNSGGNVGSSATCNWNDLSSCNLSLNTSSNHRYTMKFNASYYASASNSINVNYVLGYYMTYSIINQNVNISTNDISIYYLSGNEQINVSNKCTTTSSKSDSIPQSGKHLVYYIFNTICENINPGKNATSLVISTPLPTSISNIYNVYGRIASYSLNRITGTISDSDKIISNQTQNTQWVINNITNNTTEVINNQNQNTEKITDAIENQNEKCVEDYTIYDLNSSNYGDLNKFLNSSGLESSNNNFVITDYISIDNNKDYQLINTSGTNPSYCLYSNNKTLINCYAYNSATTINFNSGNAYYIRYSGNKSNHTLLKGEYCYNMVEKTNEELENINQSILDETPPDVDILDGIYVSNDEPVSQLILLPINLARAFLNSLGDNQCQEYVFGSLYGHTLKLTCVNLENYLGSTLYHYIDLFMSFFMIYEIFMLIVKAFNDITSLRDGFDDLYVPAHEGYKTKHNGERV